MKKRNSFYEKEMYAPDMIFLRMGTSVELVPRMARLHVAKYPSFLPRKVINFIIDRYVFIGQDQDEMGSQFLFSHPYFLGKTGFILLNSELWKRRPIKKAMTITHEVAHAVNEIRPVKYEGSTMEKRMKMEKEANDLAIKWLAKRYNK